MPTTLTKVNVASVAVAATTTPGTAIHSTGTSATIMDEVWLWAINAANDAQYNLTLEFPDAGVTSVPFVIPQNSGWVLICPGLISVGTGAAAVTVRAWANSANKLHIRGYVNRITP